jgi:hypothetical protein
LKSYEIYDVYIYIYIIYIYISNRDINKSIKRN